MMKTLEMSNFGVHEMQQEEMRETDGGVHPAIALFALECLLEVTANPKTHWNAFSTSFKDAFNFASK